MGMAISIIDDNTLHINSSDIIKDFQGAYDAVINAAESFIYPLRTIAVEMDKIINDFNSIEYENIEKNKAWQEFIGYPVKEKYYNMQHYQKKIRKNNRLLKCNKDYRENNS